jgi:lysophospholipase L1-like esterase
LTLPSGPKPLATRLAAWVGLACLAIASAELCARLDDWFFRGIAPGATPSVNDLLTFDAHGTKGGRPGGRYLRVQLNSLGIMGPELAPAPAPGCPRWLFLGASETFGQPAAGNEGYPGRLRDLLAGGRCVEVVNSAIPAMDLRAIIRRYRAELASLNANVVFIYAPTHFYLTDIDEDAAPGALDDNSRSEAVAARAASGGQQPLGQRLFEAVQATRIFERLRTSAELPGFIQRWKWQRRLDAELRSHGPEWQFSGVPARRLDALDADLRYLVERIRSDGAEPVLITHAIRAANPPRPDDYNELLNMRLYVPRASAAVLTAFEYQAAERTRQLGAAEHVRVIDAAAAFSGRRELFIDLVHYSPQGESQFAELIKREMGRPRAP